MPSTAVQSPPVQTESKSAKKKKAKAEARTESPAPSASPAAEKPDSVTGANGQDESGETGYIRELQKNIRNLNKKITNASRTDSIVAEHKDKSLDELVELKLLNPDQRAQRLKKPQLETQLAQIEEQLAQFKKVDEEYRTRLAAEKASLEKSLAEKFENGKAEAANEIKEKAEADSKKTLHDSLLTLSQFLRLAAARRSEEADAGLDENMALEGVLLSVYSGDEHAVSTMLKLIEGSDEKTVSVNGEELQTTFGQVKAAAAAHVNTILSADAAPDAAPETAPEAAETADARGAPAESSEPVATDPTAAHAGLTEVDSADATTQLTNGHTEPTPGTPANADVADDAANAAAETQWDANNDISVSQEEWVKVPRDPNETETGLTATPAETGNVQSWADDHPEHPPQSSATDRAATSGRVAMAAGEAVAGEATVVAADTAARDADVVEAEADRAVADDETMNRRRDRFFHTAAESLAPQGAQSIGKGLNCSTDLIVIHLSEQQEKKARDITWGSVFVCVL
ncbi:hypothetical protein DL766_002922 [Monosporascus sp. MC13-8B]|uniref:YAG7-like dimerisation domain-containing protein n=1 Tax=Monosporascus cannonballus TaxID=155416 RepID=A0ABY0GYX1_9PEZI|nr:hypothetical protein DL762_007502 [Monosporascus cannonballus]RYO83515.1 hypothetical protein DL763_007840 [Monosporascus cannonballus]RYP34555.1 hypothetical protein DL766_002922 [Monosporascus sp. MC13-8B]